MAESTTFDGWCILELLGHRRLGGHVTEQEIAGASFLRIDIPGDGDQIKATQFYPPSAVYCLTPTTEAMARAAAAARWEPPVQRWELPAPQDDRSEARIRPVENVEDNLYDGGEDDDTDEEDLPYD